MSRCFPFPPPGYESKPTPDGDVNSIIKEKKEKKHKDKKDKDKKERKQKERSEGKHKEDEKRKRKEKKEKKKDKVTFIEEKKPVGSSLEYRDGEKLVPDTKPTDRIQYKRTLELGKGDRNDGGALDGRIVRKITLVEKSTVDFQGKVNGMFPSRMANGQSLGVDARSSGNGLVGNCYGENRVKVLDGSCQVNKIEKRKEGKERNGYRNSFDGYETEERNTSAKAEDERRKGDEKKEKVAVRSKERIKLGASNGKFLDPSNLVKEGSNGFSHENGNQPNNTSKPALQSHQGSQNRNGFLPPHNIINVAVEKKVIITNQKVNGKLSSPQSVIKNGRNIKPCQTSNTPLTELHNGLISSQLLHIKRKIEPANSVAKVKPDEKVPLLENGGKTAVQGSGVVHKTSKKELSVNGTSEGKDGIPSSAKRKADAPMNPPHPDLKYLGRILCVPKVEWAQCDDDQEWLFGRRDFHTKRPKLESPQKQLWAEAVQLESGGGVITALPYVVPY